jgi:hypothetical protein
MGVDMRRHERMWTVRWSFMGPRVKQFDCLVEAVKLAKYLSKALGQVVPISKE